MSARTSFFASALIAALPLLAAFFGLYRFLTTAVDQPVVAPLVGVCQLAYRETLDNAGHAGIALVLCIIALFTFRAIFVFYRTWHRTSMFCRDAAPILAEAGPLAGDENDCSVAIVSSPVAFAVTVGYFKPRILVSSRLLEVLDAFETESVIRHERVHVRRRDPLRVLLADFFRAGLPFIPVLGHLLEYFHIQKETEADAEVVREMGSPAALASALSKVLSEREPLPSFGAGLTPTELRIDALLGRRQQYKSRVEVGLLSLISILSLATMSGAIFLLFSSPTMVSLHICPP